MKNNSKVAIIDFSERRWIGEYSEEGEPKRLKFYCESMPEALYWLFGGRELGNLERIAYSWASSGCPERLEVGGKFLDTGDGWLEDLSVLLVDGTDDRVSQVDGEAGEKEGDYAQDLFSFLGLKK
jgi:hypothetical protein